MSQIKKVRHEAMRIAGERVNTTDTIDVVSPFSNEVVGTVPKGQLQHVQAAFQKASDFVSPLTRHQRYEILQKTADLLVARGDEVSDVITAESGLCKKDSMYEVGRAYDVFSLSARACTVDDGQIFSCDITPHG